MSKKYNVTGQGTVTLADQDFIIEGGEGKIYAKNGVAYKIYTNPQDVISFAKIQELACLNHPHIIRPQALVLDQQHHPVGYTMQHITNTIALPRFFTQNFKQQQHIQTTDLFSILQTIKETIHFIHQQNCLMVDGNEMNYLVNKDNFKQVYFIDVDSYQTPSFPATALMPSIQDYHTQGFNQLTDWFAFAILACQILLGIHPYKGKHPTLKNLAARMQANISIFNKAVSLPHTVGDINQLPDSIKAWFIQLFEQGQRSPPPDLYYSAQIPAPSTPSLTGNKKLSIQKLHDYPDPITAYYSYHGQQAVLTYKEVYINQDSPQSLPISDSFIIFETNTLTPIIAYTQQQYLSITIPSLQYTEKTQLLCDHLFYSDNQLYTIYKDKLNLIRFTATAKRYIVSIAKSWQIMPHALKIYDQLLYQQVLGMPYLLLPYGSNACAQCAIPELKPYKIIQGQHENGVVSLIGYQQGRYDHILLRFDTHYQHYQCHIDKDKECLENNVITLDNHTIILIPEDEQLTIKHRDHNIEKQVHDPVIHTQMHLIHEGINVYFYTSHSLYRMTMQ